MTEADKVSWVLMIFCIVVAVMLYLNTKEVEDNRVTCNDLHACLDLYFLEEDPDTDYANTRVDSYKLRCPNIGGENTFHTSVPQTSGRGYEKASYVWGSSNSQTQR